MAAYTLYEHYLLAEDKRCDVAKSLDELTQLLRSHDALTKTASDIVRKAQSDLITQQTSLDAFLDAIPPINRKPPGAAVLVQKAIDVPELLEHILNYLDIRSLLRVQQVSHQMFDAIESSVKLQRRLFLKPSPKGNTKLLPSYVLPGLFLDNDASGYVTPRSDMDQVVVTASFLLSRAPSRIGSRCKKMLICNPPIKSIDVFIECCSQSAHRAFRTNTPRPPLETLECDSGITVGQLHDAHKRLAAAHRLCPDASPHLHNKDGFVNAEPSFEVALDLNPNDPLVAAKNDKVKKRKLRTDESDGFMARIRTYVVAKQTARDHGRPIPTLSEFETAQAVEQG